MGKSWKIWTTQPKWHLDLWEKWQFFLGCKHRQIQIALGRGWHAPSKYYSKIYDLWFMDGFPSCKPLIYRWFFHLNNLLPPGNVSGTSRIKMVYRENHRTKWGMFVTFPGNYRKLMMCCGSVFTCAWVTHLCKGLSVWCVCVCNLNLYVGNNHISIHGKTHGKTMVKPWFPVNFPNKTNPLICSMVDQFQQWLS